MWLAIDLVVAAVIFGFAIAEIFSVITLIVIVAVLADFGWRAGTSTWMLLAHWQFFPIYLLIGLIWVFFKWTRLVNEKLAEARRYKHANQSPPSWYANWPDFIGHFFWWPLSMVAYIIKDLTLDLWEWIAKQFSKMFDSYAQYRFKELQK